MASRSLAYRKLPQRGVPHFMGRASVLAQPRAELRALWKSLSFSENLVGSALPVVLTQQGPQWCWAAVSQAVLALDDRRTTQQEIVNRHTGRNCPITNGSSSTPGDCTAAYGCARKCDDPHNLLVAISGWGVALENLYLPDHPDALAKLRAALASRPVAARVKFSDGSAHFILITRCSGADGNPTVRFLSPIPAEGSPFPVKPEEQPWLSLTSIFRLAGGFARLSHIYPRQ